MLSLSLTHFRINLMLQFSYIYTMAIKLKFYPLEQVLYLVLFPA